MTTAEIKVHFEKERIQLTLGEKFNHFQFIIPILLIPITMLYARITSGIAFSSFSYFEIILYLIAVYYIYFQVKVLKFKKINLDHTSTNFKEAAKATALELNWKIEILRSDLLIARKYDLGWQWDGLRITIIREGSKIFANSIVNPTGRCNPHSFGWNKKNIQTFNNNLLYSSRGENVVQKVKKIRKQKRIKLENESEWNTKNLVKRIVAYFIIFLLLGCCLIIMIEGFNLLVIPVILICLAYLVMDVKLILNKEKK